MVLQIYAVNQFLIVLMLPIVVNVKGGFFKCTDILGSQICRKQICYEQAESTRPFCDLTFVWLRRK